MLRPHLEAMQSRSAASCQTMRVGAVGNSTSLSRSLTNALPRSESRNETRRLGWPTAQSTLCGPIAKSSSCWSTGHSANNCLRLGSTTEMVPLRWFPQSSQWRCASRATGARAPDDSAAGSAAHVPTSQPKAESPQTSFICFICFIRPRPQAFRRTDDLLRSGTFIEQKCSQ